MSSPADRRSLSRNGTRDSTPDPNTGSPRRVHRKSMDPSQSPSSPRSRRRSRSRSDDNRSYSRSLSPDQTEMPRSAKIVVEKLTKNVNESHLHEIFGSYGAISQLEMPTNKQFMMNKGIAYVLYADADQAADAIAHMHEAQLDGAVISVSIVLPRRRLSNTPPPRRPPPNRFGEPNRLREGGSRHNIGSERPHTNRGRHDRSPPYHSQRGPNYSRSGDSGRSEGSYGEHHAIRRSYRDRSFSPRPSYRSQRRPSVSHMVRDRSGRSRSRSPQRRR